MFKMMSGQELPQLKKPEMAMVKKRARGRIGDIKTSLSTRAVVGCFISARMLMKANWFIEANSANKYPLQKCIPR